MRRPALILLSMLSYISLMAWDDASVRYDSSGKGCLHIPSSISLSDDCRPCELFRVTSGCSVEYYQIDIYDRYQARVYGNSDIHQFWDGSVNKSYVPVGCYSYQIEYRMSIDSPLEIHKGTVLFLH